MEVLSNSLCVCVRMGEYVRSVGQWRRTGNGALNERGVELGLRAVLLGGVWACSNLTPFYRCCPPCRCCAFVKQLCGHTQECEVASNNGRVGQLRTCWCG